MRKNLQSLLIVLMLAIANIGHAQDAQVAKAYYIKAREAFEQKDYQKTVEYLEDAKREWNGTNPDIIALELEARFNVDKTDPLIESLAKEFKSKDRIGDNAKITKLSMLVVEHKEAVEAARKMEQEAFERALAGNDLDYSREFVTKFPNNPNVGQVTTMLEQTEQRYYNEALTADKVDTYHRYISGFPEGKNKPEMAQKMEVARERDLYQSVSSNQSISGAKNYLTQYPQGTYREEVKLILEDKLYLEGTAQLKQDNLYVAKSTFSEYKQYLPDGKRTKEVDAALKTIENKQARIESKENRSSANYFAVTYATSQAFGFEFGKLHKSKLGMYFNVNVNPNFTSLTFSPEEVETGDLNDDQIDEFLEEFYDEAFLTASIGLNYCVAYPVWLYVGGGVRQQEFMAKEGGGDNEDESIVPKDRGALHFFPEAGIRAKFGKLIVKAGAQLINGETSFQVGIGIRTRKF